MKTMRLIERIVCSFVLLALLTGCDNRIERPGDIESLEPAMEDARYTVTASMLSTKVSYSDNNGYMFYAWEETDIGRIVVFSDGKNNYEFIVTSIVGTKATMSYFGEIENPSNFTGKAVLRRDSSPSRQICNGCIDDAGVPFDKLATAHLGNGETFIASLEGVNFNESVTLSFELAETSLFKMILKAPVPIVSNLESGIPEPELRISTRSTQLGKVTLGFSVAQDEVIVAYLRCDSNEHVDDGYYQYFTLGLQYDGKLYEWSMAATTPLSGGKYFWADLQSVTPTLMPSVNIEVLSTTTDFFD